MGSGTEQVEFALGCLGKGGDRLEKVAFEQRLDGMSQGDFWGNTILVRKHSEGKD